MCVFRPRRNWSLSTLAEKKRTWMRSMITATAKTRQIAIGYMPKPPPFQCCATVSKIGLIRFRPLEKKSSKPAGTAGPPRLPRTGPLARSAIWVPLTESAIGRLLLLPGAAAAATAEAGTGPLRRARFRTPMAREVTFPRTRHVALSGLEQGGEAKAAGSEAILVPIRVAAQVTPPAGVPLPPPVEPGAPGVPEKGALPAAAPVPALEAGTEAPAPQTRQVPWVIAADVGMPTGETDRCRALDGAPAEVRCASSLEGRDAAGGLAARAALAGEAVLLEGLDRWYRLGPEGAGYCRSCELALVEYLREAYGDHLEPFDALDSLRSSALPLRERPFARQKEALRLSESVEAAKRAVLRARDEARRNRSVEMAVLGRVGTLTPLALELCRHLDGLVFDLPSLDPFAALLPLLAARAALGLRPAVAVLPAGASAAQVQLFAGLATACDADRRGRPHRRPALPRSEVRPRARRRRTRVRARRGRPGRSADPRLAGAVDPRPPAGHHQRPRQALLARVSRSGAEAGRALRQPRSSGNRLRPRAGRAGEHRRAGGRRRPLGLLVRAGAQRRPGRREDHAQPLGLLGLDHPAQRRRLCTPCSAAMSDDAPTACRG